MDEVMLEEAGTARQIFGTFGTVTFGNVTINLFALAAGALAGLALLGLRENFVLLTTLFLCETNLNAF